MNTNLSFGMDWSIELQTTCYGFMNIVKLYDHDKVTKQTPINVTKVIPNGLQFVSFLHLPIHENVIWRFQFQIWEDAEQCEGILASRRKIKGGYEYRALLNSLLEQRNSRLNKVLNQYSYFNEDTVTTARMIDLSC